MIQLKMSDLYSAEERLQLTFGEYVIALRCQAEGKPIPFPPIRIEATNRALAAAEAKYVNRKNQQCD